MIASGERSMAHIFFFEKPGCLNGKKQKGIDLQTLSCAE